MMYVTRRATFSASHRLYNAELSEEENFRLFDKCASPNGHGHNYVLEVTVAGEVGEETGYVLDLKELKKILAREILDKVDHKHLNHDVDFLRGVIPTAENIAMAFWNVLAPAIPRGRLHSIRLQETENNAVEYRGEQK
ncbi:MAG: 6-carboxy-5,6,7,8-tetrahydropterin synthase [Bacteroidia bacterium]|nr:MAG: 6-carboxy-5,6,7,8-tetrahydropterin synthase [Bacteroidia bacterium]